MFSLQFCHRTSTPPTLSDSSESDLRWRFSCYSPTAEWPALPRPHAQIRLGRNRHRRSRPGPSFSFSLTLSLSSAKLSTHSRSTSPSLTPFDDRLIHTPPDPSKKCLRPLSSNSSFGLMDFLQPSITHFLLFCVRNLNPNPASSNVAKTTINPNLPIIITNYPFLLLFDILG